MSRPEGAGSPTESPSEDVKRRLQESVDVIEHAGGAFVGLLDGDALKVIEGLEAEIERLTKELAGVTWGRDQNARACEVMEEELARLRNSGEPVAWRWKDSGHRDWHYRVGEPCDLKDREGVVMEALFLAPEPDDE